MCGLLVYWLVGWSVLYLSCWDCTLGFLCSVLEHGNRGDNDSSGSRSSPFFTLVEDKDMDEEEDDDVFCIEDCEVVAAALLLLLPLVEVDDFELLD